MKFIPRFLRGSYLVGPNGFTKHKADGDFSDMFSIYWYPNFGLVVQRHKDSKTISYKVYLKSLTKALLGMRLRKEEKQRLKASRRREKERQRGLKEWQRNQGNQGK